MTRKHHRHSGLYIHIPFCRKKCAYCNFCSTTSCDHMDEFLKALFTEMNLYVSSWSRFDTLYIGGGTPSLLTMKQCHALLLHLRESFNFTESPEITIEVNPADLNFQDLQCLRDMGINRISIGIQSFDDQILVFLGRRHTASDARNSMRDARKAGFNNISLDLIYGVPGQDLASWMDTLGETLTFDPEHLSCYQLTVEGDTPLGESHRTGAFVLPDEDAQYDFFMATSERLEAAGYIHYEVSNFARNREAISKHNSKYWNHSPYLGLGPSAHSFAETTRSWNTSSLPQYMIDLQEEKAPVASTETLSLEALRLEALFLGFRTKKGIHLKHFNTRFECDLLEEKAKMIEILQDSGFISIEDGYLCPTPSGLAVADSLSLI